MLGHRGDLCSHSLQFSWGDDTCEIVTVINAVRKQHRRHKKPDVMRGW